MFNLIINDVIDTDVAFRTNIDRFLYTVLTLPLVF